MDGKSDRFLIILYNSIPVSDLFHSHMVKNLGIEVMYPVIRCLIQNMCAKVADKVDYRRLVAQVCNTVDIAWSCAGNINALTESLVTPFGKMQRADTSM